MTRPGHARLAGCERELGRVTPAQVVERGAGDGAPGAERAEDGGGGAVAIALRGGGAEGGIPAAAGGLVAGVDLGLGVVRLDGVVAGSDAHDHATADRGEAAVPEGEAPVARRW